MHTWARARTTDADVPVYCSYIARPCHAPTDTPVPLQDGKTVLDLAESCDDEVKREEVKAVFARHSLLAAAQFGMEELVAEHIAQGTDLTNSDGRGRTALMLASRGGHLAAVQALLEASADVEETDEVSPQRLLNALGTQTRT
jgi:ankyrin repeat protein